MGVFGDDEKSGDDEVNVVGEKNGDVADHHYHENL